MDELVKLVAQKTGIPEAQAKIAVQTVIGFLKERLPAPLAGQIEGLLSGKQTAEALKDLGELLGGK